MNDSANASSSFVFGPASLSLRYQLSRRLTDDHGVVMFVMLGT
jgi:hypothetical protein